ncbi:MAG: hypothetical protein VKK32_01265 [Candidatus Melainabacteria bacterium]|nr:hypothetical protein [Candidatus Melainabacteria bacterium]
MSEINIDALREITFSRLKDENFDNFLDDKNKDASIKQYKSLESSHVALKTDVESSLQFISALNQLAVLADTMADAKKRELDKGKQDEYKEKFEKIQKTILNQIDIPDDFVQLIQVASTGGIEALRDVASWARKTAKDMRNDEELNEKIEKLQEQQKKLEGLGRTIFKDASSSEERYDRYALLKKAFRTNSSEEEYRMQLVRLERMRKQEGM